MRVLLCSCPPTEAEDLARTLVEERRAACVNLLPAVRSFYDWEGAIHDEVESTLIIKVGDAQVEATVARLIELHSYDVPEVLVLPVEVERSSADYVDWVRQMTQRSR